MATDTHWPMFIPIVIILVIVVGAVNAENLAVSFPGAADLPLCADDVHATPYLVSCCVAYTCHVMNLLTADVQVAMAACANVSLSARLCPREAVESGLCGFYSDRLAQSTSPNLRIPMTWTSTNCTVPMYPMVSSIQYASASTTKWARHRYGMAGAVDLYGYVIAGGYDGVGTYYNDVWRTHDAGYTWTRVTATSSWKPRFSFGLAALAGGTALVLFGGDDGHIEAFNDVWKSVDGGHTWSFVARAPWTGRSRFASAAHPVTDRILIIGGYNTTALLMDEIWCSDDGGASWRQFGELNSQRISTRHAFGLAAILNSTFVLTGGLESGLPDAYNDVWRSDDGGASWYSVNVTKPFSVRSHHCAISEQPATLWVLGGKTHNDYLNDVWQSFDAGVTWTQVAIQPSFTSASDSSCANLGNGHFLTIGGHEALTGYKFALADCWISSDGGRRWSLVGGAPTSWEGRYAAGLTTDPSGQMFLIGGIGFGPDVFSDVWYSRTGGASWNRLVEFASFGRRENFQVVSDSSGTLFLTGGLSYQATTAANDIYSSTDGGLTWHQIVLSPPFGGRSGAQLVFYNNSLILAGGEKVHQGPLFNDVWGSPDGLTWSLISDNSSWSVRWQFSLLVWRGSLLLIGGVGRIPQSDTVHNYVSPVLADIWRSDDGGANWVLVLNDAPWHGREQFGAAVDNFDHILICGGASGTDAMNDLWQSPDGGVTWLRLDTSDRLPLMYGLAMVSDGRSGVVIAGGTDVNIAWADTWRVILFPRPSHSKDVDLFVPDTLDLRFAAGLLFSTEPYEEHYVLHFGTGTISFRCIHDDGVLTSTGIMVSGSQELSPLPTNAAGSVVQPATETITLLDILNSFKLSPEPGQKWAIAGTFLTFNWGMVLLRISVSNMSSNMLTFNRSILAIFGGSTACYPRSNCILPIPTTCDAMKTGITAQYTLIYVLCRNGTLFTKILSFDPVWPFFSDVRATPEFAVSRSLANLGAIVDVVACEEYAVALSDAGVAIDLRSGLIISVSVTIRAMYSSNDMTQRICFLLSDGTVALYSPWLPAPQSNYDPTSTVMIFKAEDGEPYVACAIKPSPVNIWRDGLGALVLIRRDGSLDVPTQTAKGFPQVSALSVVEAKAENLMLRSYYGASSGALLRYYPCWDLIASGIVSIYKGSRAFNISRYLKVHSLGYFVLRAGVIVDINSDGCERIPRMRGTSWNELSLSVDFGSSESQRVLAIGKRLVPCVNASSAPFSSSIESLCEFLPPNHLGLLSVRNGNGTIESLTYIRVVAGLPSWLSMTLVLPAKFGDPIWSLGVSLRDDLGYPTSFTAIDEFSGDTAASSNVSRSYWANISISGSTGNASRLFLPWPPGDATAYFRDLPVQQPPGEDITVTVQICAGDDSYNCSLVDSINAASGNFTAPFCEPMTSSYAIVNDNSSLYHCVSRGCDTLVGLRCHGGVETDVLPGYWRPSGASWVSRLDDCSSFPGACVGSDHNASKTLSATEGDALCDSSRGHFGVLCGQCLPKYVMTRLFKCAKCGSLEPLFITLFILGCILVFTTLALLQLRAAATCGVAMKQRDKDSATWPTWQRGVDSRFDQDMSESLLTLHGQCEECVDDDSAEPHTASYHKSGGLRISLAAFYLKLLLNYVQSSSGVLEAMEKDWAGPIDSLGRLKLQLFSVWDTNSFRCGLSSRFSARVMTTVFFIIAWCVLVGGFHQARKRSAVVYRLLTWWPLDRSSVRAHRVFTLGNFLLTFGVSILYTIYPSVVSIFVEGLVCVDVPTLNASHLLVDMAVPCVWTYREFVIGRLFSIFGVIFIAIGFPFGLFIALLNLRKQLFCSPTLVARLGFLYIGYRPVTFYFEPIVQVARFLSMVTLTARNTTLQLFGLKLITGTELVLTIMLRPYVGSSQSIQVASLILVLVQLIIASVVVEQPAVLPEGAEYFLGLILMLGDILVIGLFLREVINETYETFLASSARFHLFAQAVQSTKLYRGVATAHDFVAKAWKRPTGGAEGSAPDDFDGRISELQTLLQEKEQLIEQLQQQVRAAPVVELSDPPSPLP